VAKIQATNTNGHHPKVVVIGGGSGSSTILTGLRQYKVSLTAIVTMFDSGGSSGLLRKEFGYPPFGDLRQCLLALADRERDSQALLDAFEFRFGNDSSLNGHSVGNLILAALMTLSNDLERAINEVSQILHVIGSVVPVTLAKAELCAELEDGCLIRGESEIDLRSEQFPRIRRIFLDEDVAANPRAVAAIKDADAIVLGPGDLYTSILPNLLARGIPEAIAESRATCIYVSNLMTKLGETDGFTASDFVREISRYLEPARLDWAVVNTGIPGQGVQMAYEKEGAHLVELDLNEVGKYVSGTIAASLAYSELPLRHDPAMTAEAIFQAIDAGRLVSEPGFRPVFTIA
jgi:uncharacterized cofD-like protein